MIWIFPAGSSVCRGFFIVSFFFLFAMRRDFFMNVTVNGKDLSLDKSINLKELLVVAKAEQPDYVTVELNGEFVDHKGFESTFVKDGDKIEFLYFMGGGAR